MQGLGRRLFHTMYTACLYCVLLTRILFGLCFDSGFILSLTALLLAECNGWFRIILKTPSRS